MVHPYLSSLVAALEEKRDAARAVQSKAYLKGQYEFYGISAPVLRDVLRSHIRSTGLPAGKEELEAVVREAWACKEREMQYCGVELFDRFLRKNDAVLLKLLEYMVITKSWWDTVDAVASWLIGTTFGRHPELIAPNTRRWMDSGNIWLQRTCLIFQLKYKGGTDQDLLFGYIRELAGNKTFWIRKAIGWALREYSKTNPQAVVDFVKNQELSGLSRREALRIIERKSKYNSEFL